MNSKTTKKKSFKEVKDAFSSASYVLLTQEQDYKNSTTKMLTVCPKGHEYSVSYSLFVGRAYRCPRCSGNIRRSVEEAQQCFVKLGYVPIFKEYKKNTIPVDVICPNGHAWKPTLNNFLRGVRCPTCTGHTTKHNLESVKDFFAKDAYKLVSTEYINANTKLNTICPKGHEYPVKYGDFYTGYRCGICKSYTSKGEKELLGWIQTMFPNAKKKRGKHNGSNYEIDIFIPELNLGIEYNGLYWHSEAFKSKNDHKNKMDTFNSLGYRLISIFEDEWINRNGQVKNFLLSVFHKNEHTIYARKTQIKPISTEQGKVFLNENHIQGATGSAVYFGLFHDQGLVGVISGNAHHRDGHGSSLVLNRLCFNHGVNVVGGSSKLTKALLGYAKNLGFKKLISWSDNRWSEGKVYKALGFTLEEELDPDYSYVYKRKRIPKQSCTKTKLLKKGAIGSTEKEMASSLGYLKIWDCGKKRWGIIL